MCFCRANKVLCLLLASSLSFLGACTTSVSPRGRMCLNVHLNNHSVEYYNQFALESPVFDRHVTVAIDKRPMTEFQKILLKQAGISSHAIDRAGDKVISVNGKDEKLRVVLLDLARRYGFLYECDMAKDNTLNDFFIYNVDPMIGPMIGENDNLPPVGSGQQDQLSNNQ